MNKEITRNFTLHFLAVLFGFGMMNVNQLFGASLTGSEIHFTKVGTLKYDVYFTLYRSCNGIAFKLSSNDCKISNNDGTNSKSILPTLVSIADITPLCNKVGKPCNPPNTGFTGDGTERHLYKITIDFNKAPYDTLYLAGKPILFSFSNCCRNSNITNGAANANQYNYALLDLSLGDVSGAYFGNQTIRYLGASAPFYYSFVAKGFDEDDSISYKLGDVLYGYNAVVKTTPIATYDPTGKGKPNPNTDPPIGMNFNQQTGDWIFTPTSASEVATVVVEAIAWRRDTSGKMQKISVIRRDMVYQIGTLPGSAGAPRMKSASPYTICENEKLDILISTEFAKTSSNPIYLFVLDTIEGSTSQVIDTFNHQKYQFSWTPPLGKARNHPYSFVLLAVDSNCNILNHASRSFSIFVKPTPQTKIEAKSMNCNVFHATSTPNPSLPNLKYAWRVLDSSGKIEQNDEVIYFPSTKSAKSNLQNDSFYARVAGVYIVEHTVTSVDNCFTIWYDTIDVKSTITTLFSNGDTLLCKPNTLSIKQNLHNDALFSKYQWSNGDTSKSTALPFNNKSAKYFLKAYANAGCFYFDDIQVNQAESPKLILPQSIQRCGEIDTTVKVKLVNTYPFMTSSVFWDITKTDSVKITETGMYHITAANACGTVQDSVLFVELEVPKVDLGSADTFACAGEMLILSPQVESNYATFKYLWSDGSSLSTLAVNILGTYSVSVSNVCGQQRDTIVVSKFVKKPNIVFVNETFICNGIPAKIGGEYPDSKLLWSTGETSNYITVNTPKKITLTVSNGCGIDIDSVQIVAETSPKVLIPSDTFYCANVPLRLNGGGTNAWYLWSTGEITRTVFLTKAGNYWVKAENGCGVDSSSFTLTEKQKPKVDLGSDTTLFAGQLMLDAGNVGSTYLWSTGEKTQIIEAVSKGLYWVEVSNDCGKSRDSIMVRFGALDDLNRQMFKLYPNPSNGLFTITSELDLGVVKMELVSLNGSILGAEMMQVERMDGSSLMCTVNKELHGVYFLKITHQKGTSFHRIVIY